MKALGKILGLVFLGLLLILVALGFALTHFFDPNDYKDEISQLARDKANLELQLRGDIGWSLFPWLGIELHDATLASASTPDKPFANLQMIGLSVRVLPLLRKEVQMSDIRVQGLDLTLQRDEQGHGNWEGVGRKGDATVAETGGTNDAAGDAGTADDGTGQRSRALSLDIDSLTVRDSRVDYQDARSGQQFHADGIEVTTGAIREGHGIPLKIVAYPSVAQPAVNARLELEGEGRFDQHLQRYQLANAHLSGEASGEPLNGKTLSFDAEGQLMVDRAAQIAEWTNLKLSANELRALGDVRVRGLETEPKLEGGLSVAEMDLRAFLEGIGITLPKMAAQDALARFEMAARLTGDRNSIRFEDLKATLDGAQLTGAAAVVDIGRQAVRLQLKGDRLDADRYLPPAEKQTSQRQAEVDQTLSSSRNGTTPLPEQPTQQAWSDEPVLPLDRLRTLDAQVQLELGTLVLKKIPFQDARLKADAKEGLLRLQQLRAAVQGGELETSASVDVRQPEPRLSLKASSRRMPLEPFLALSDQPAPVRGALDLTASFDSRGNSEKAWVQSLNGNARFAINDGVLLDANLEQQLCQGIALLNRESLSSEPRGRDTPFRELQGSLAVRNGVASNPDLQASIPGLSVSGNGDLDLRVLGLDYRVGVTIEGDDRAMPDPACTVNERYVGIEWPLRCRGPLELGAKACRLDREGLGQIAAKLAKDRLGEKIDEKLGDKIKPELRDALKGLFNR